MPYMVRQIRSVRRDFSPQSTVGPRGDEASAMAVVVVVKVAAGQRLGQSCLLTSSLELHSWSPLPQAAALKPPSEHGRKWVFCVKHTNRHFE